MGLVRSQTVGEGMLITGKGRTIKILIGELDRDKKTVKFGVEGVVGVEELALSSTDGLRELVDGIEIQVGNKLPYDDRYIRINYHATQEYHFEPF